MPMTEFVYLQGKTKWFRNKTPNQWGRWTHDLYLSPESLVKFRELQDSTKEVTGVKNHLKKDDDGYYISITRPVEKTYAGKRTGLVPPAVLDAESIEFDGLVGNGSDVTTKVEVYMHHIPASKGMAKAMRWVSSRIDHLVPYEGLRDRAEKEAKAVAGLPEQPPQKQHF